jgi:hypothetical protein
MAGRSRPGWTRPQSHFSQDPGGRRKAAPAAVPDEVIGDTFEIGGKNTTDNPAFATSDEGWEYVCYHGEDVSVDQTALMPIVPPRDPKYDLAMAFEDKHPKIGKSVGLAISLLIIVLFSLAAVGLIWLLVKTFDFATSF